ncbi:MAG: hypothetical protein U0R71_00115 [Solirubrobacterales bacterium]
MDPRLRPRAAAATATLLLLALAAALALGGGGAAGEGRTAATCTGAIEGTAFHFSCDSAIGGNAQGWLFTVTSARISGVSVAEPAGIACSGKMRRLLCKGPAIAAGTRVAGSLTLGGGSGGGGELEGEGEGEGSCPGEVSAALLLYGREETANEFGEEELEEGGEEMASTPVPIGRFGLSSCRAAENEGGGEEAAAGLRLGKPKLRPHSGTALLPVSVPDAGMVTLGGEGLVKASLLARAAKSMTLPVRPKGTKRQQLHRAGRVAVRARVRFTPLRGPAVVRTKKIVLRYAPG